MPTSPQHIYQTKGSVFCFGELLLRMSPVMKGQWIESNSMPVFVGGAELNVATALACWKIPVRYGTALPDNNLSQEIVQSLVAKSIDVSAIHYSGERIGLYYLPQGADLQHSGVIYDRSHSAFANLRPGMIDWDQTLRGCGWFHFSAISPAVSESAAAVCREALEAAQRLGLTISVDLNYRARLWQYGKRPVDIMPELVRYCQVVMGNIWSANALLDIPLSIKDKQALSKKDFIQLAETSTRSIMQAFPYCKTVANTFRFEEGEGIRYYAVLGKEKESVVSQEWTARQVVDRIGSGDCFMAGLIYGLHHGHALQEIADFAAAAAFGKLQEKGDATNQRIESINQKVIQHGSTGPDH